MEFSQLNYFILILVLEVNGFCYDINNLQCGPLSSEWPASCRNGRAQSPIKLPLTNDWSYVFFQIQRHIISFNTAYQNGVNQFFIANNGETVRISVTNDLTSTMVLQSTLYPDPYAFAQVHCHWESEHTYGLYRYPLECHFVHYNTKFANINDAIASGELGAVLVLAMFYTDTGFKWHNKVMEPFINNLNQVVNEGTPLNINGPLNIYDMLRPLTAILPRMLSLFGIGNGGGWFDTYSYTGSLTTPMCNEGVYWLVMRHPTIISTLQLNQFYALRNAQNGPMRGNYRQLQPRNGRFVQAIRLNVEN